MLARWRPMTQLDKKVRMGDLFSNMKNDFFENGLNVFKNCIKGDMDILENENEYKVKAVIPGVDSQDIDIELEDNNLTVKAETNQENTEEGDNYLRREIVSSSYCRTIPLPKNIDKENITADYKSGILELKLPKNKSYKSQKINIQCKK